MIKNEKKWALKSLGNKKMNIKTIKKVDSIHNNEKNNFKKEKLWIKSVKVIFHKCNLF